MNRQLINGVWVTELRSPDGATALIADHGAHLLSWKPAGGNEALYLSKLSKYGGNSAIRGGVPIIFPQFGERGSGPRHGFARTSNWRQEFAGIEQEHGVARFRLSNEDVMDFKSPDRLARQFELLFEISISAQQLKMVLSVHNSSSKQWEFCAALHTYLLVSDIANIEIDGLQTNRYENQVTGDVSVAPDTQRLRIDAEIDRIYQAVQNPVVLKDRDRSAIIRNHGFNDVVIWNPGKEKAAQINDMVAQDYREFVCVEAAVIEKAVMLEAGESWSGSQSIVIGNSQP